MAVSAKTQFPVGQLEIFVARTAAVFGAHFRRVDVREFDGLVFLERSVHVRLLVTAQVMVAGHSGRIQAGGEHVVVGVIAAHAFCAARTRDVAMRTYRSDFGFDRRTIETAKTLRPDRSLARRSRTKRVTSNYY